MSVLTNPSILAPSYIGRLHPPCGSNPAKMLKPTTPPHFRATGATFTHAPCQITLDQLYTKAIESQCTWFKQFYRRVTHGLTKVAIRTAALLQGDLSDCGCTPWSAAMISHCEVLSVGKLSHAKLATWQ